MPLTKRFYPRLSYGSPATNIDWDDTTGPAARVRPFELPMRGINVSVGGAVEVLWERNEVRLLLSFIHLPTAQVSALYTWWNTHASKGKQSTIDLDRLATCAGQWEYDTYRTFFDKAVLLNNPFQPERSILASAKYQIELLFLQAAS